MSVSSPLASSGEREQYGPQEQRQYGFVPVQMTNLVPVRVVSVHGDFFDMEIHQDAPLHIVQRAAEDCFKVRPELQLLTHNRKPINPNQSLRRNGCLLLKGDPFVKIVLDVKKGSRLNIVCQMAHCEPIPLACEAEDTIWDVKKKFCSSLEKSEVTPQRIRLLWRYWELNDKATVDYYHIPTNSKLTVMKKRDILGGQQTERRRAPSQRRRQDVQRRHERCDADTDDVAAWPKAPSVVPPYEKYRQASGREPLEGEDSRSKTPNANGSAQVVEGGADRDSHHPPIRAWPALPQEQFGRAVIPLYPIVPPLSGGSYYREPRAQTPDRRPAVVPVAEATQVVDFTEVQRLRMEVEELGRRMETCVTDRAEFSAMEESFRAAVTRVSELEASVGRVQNLLKRALHLM